MDKRRLTDAEMNRKVDELITNAVNNGKKTTRSLIDILVEKTTQSVGEIFDKNVELLKQKLKKRLIKDGKQQEESSEGK